MIEEERKLKEIGGEMTEVTVSYYDYDKAVGVIFLGEQTKEEKIKTLEEMEKYLHSIGWSGEFEQVITPDGVERWDLWDKIRDDEDEEEEEV